eukprot:scaffold826_cov335-Pavlova_lutheri.AAC.18
MVENSSYAFGMRCLGPIHFLSGSNDCIGAQSSEKMLPYQPAPSLVGSCSPAPTACHVPRITWLARGSLTKLPFPQGASLHPVNQSNLRHSPVPGHTSAKKPRKPTLD